MASEFLKRKAAQSRQRVTQESGSNAYGGENYDYAYRKPDLSGMTGKQSGGSKLNPQSVAQSIVDEHNRNENVRARSLADSIAREHDQSENTRSMRDSLSMLRTTSGIADRVRDYQNAAAISAEHDDAEDVRGAALRMLAEKVSREHDWNEDAKTPESRRMRASAYADELTRGIQAGTMAEEERKRLAYQMRREATSGNLIENHFNNTDAFSEEELNQLSRLFNLATRGRVENAMAGIGSSIAANLSALPSAAAQDASDWKKYRDQYGGDYWKDFFTQPVSEVRQNQVDAGFTGRPLDESSFARKTYGISQEQKNAATAGLSENGIAGTKYFSPKWLAEQGISVVENAPNMLLTAMNPAVGTAYMVGNAGGNRALELSEQGVNAGEAVQRGLVSGAIEALTEKYSIENFLDAFTNNRGALLNILSQMGVEASEESASYVLNYVADLAARDPNAEFSVAELIDNAMGGAFSGGIYGGIGQVGRAVGNAAARTSGIRDAAEQEQSRTAQNATTAPIPAESFAQGETTPAESVLDRAMREQADRGSVSNSTAEAILADSDAMDALSVRTDSGMTKSQQRAAVKEAVRSRQNAQESAVSETGNEVSSDTENAVQAEKPRTVDTSDTAREVAAAVQDTPLTREVVEADLAALDAARGVLGENGVKSIRALYDGRQGTIGADELYRSYLPYYEAGVNGRDVSTVDTRYRGVLNEVETKIAYEAGQMDAAKSLQAEKAAAPGMIVYDRKTAGATAQTGVKVDRNTMRTLDSAAKALGVKIIVEQQLEGGANGYIRNGEIHLSASARNPLLVVAAHEITHRMQDMSPESYRAYRDYVMNALSTARGGSVASLIQSKIDSYQRSQVNSGFGQALTAEQAMDELAADFTREMMYKTDLFERFSKQNRTAAQKLLDAVRSFIRKVKSMFPKNRAAQNAAAQAEFGADMDILVQAEKLWSKALETAETASVDHANRTDSDNGFSGVRDETVRHSLQNDELFMEKARKKNKSTGFVSASEMDAAEKARSVIANLFRDPALQDALNLPQDVMGNTFLANSSYGGSEENTTICIRTLAAEYLMDAVAEELGRPLTVEDTIAISQEYWKYTDKPECLYCYVAMDRKAHREFLGRYLEMRDEVTSDIRNGMSVDEAREKFLEEHGSTDPMKNRFEMWAKNAASNADVITPRDLASPKNMELAAARSKSVQAQINDALKYAQSASWAKKRISYKAYNNHILRWTQKRVNDLNDHYGLRMYSFSDFSPAFILENMQMFTDAAVRGLKVLAYTKELDFVRIFAKTGANINISVFAHEQNGQISEDAMQGAPWKEAQELRSQHRNVGCTFVATNDNQVAWALDQDWIDVVIPFHLVRNGSKVAQAFGWKNYTAMSADVKDKANGWDANRDKTGIYPTEHLNDKEKYLAALEENHLKPRFAEWIDHPNYMKLVNECRQSVLQSEAVKPVFNVDAAKRSINDMIKRGGYYVPIGGSEANMRDIAGEIAESVEDKKTARTDGKKYSSREIRFPQQTNDDLHSVTEQAREINRLRAQLERAREQTRRTGAYSVDKRKISKTVRAIFDRYSSDLSGTEAESALKALYAEMATSLNRKAVDYDVLRVQARQIAEQIAASAEDTSDDASVYLELRRTLRSTGISISDADKADIPDFNSFRKRNFGRLKITKDGTPVDEFYVHLSEAFPEFFDHERETHPAEQLQRIAEVYEEVSGSKTRNLFGEDMEGAIEDITSDIIGSFFTIPHAKQTFADRQAGKLEAARADAKQSKAELSALTRQYDRDTSAMEKTRARALESLEETRTAHAREVQKLRDRFAERTKAGRERQNERELRNKIKRHVDKLSRKLLQPTDQHHVPEELRPVIARALASIDLSDSYTLKYDPNSGVMRRVKRGAEPIKGTETNRTQAFLALRSEYARIAGEDSGMVVDPDLLEPDGLLDQVAQLGDTRIADMNTEQLQTVWKTVRALEHAVVTAGKLLAGTKYAGTAAWADAMMRDTSTFRVRRTTAVSYFATDLETPYTFFSHYGEAGKAIYRMLRDAQDAQQVKTDRIALETAKLVDGKTVRKLQKETHRFDVDGRTLTLTTAHIMELYELSKREQAQEHLMRGGIVQPEIKSAKVERGTESIPLSLDQIAEIVGTLTDDQKRIADGLQKLMSTTLADWGNEASMKAYGYKKFTGADYWPIHSASEGVHQNAEKSEGNARSIKNIGMAKNTIPHASNALDISGVFQTFAGHAADMIDYSTWLCPMEDANRLFNYQYRDENGVKTGQSVMGMLNRYGGQGAQKYWKNLMNDIQNGIKSNDDTRIGRITQKLYSNVKGAAVGANVRVIIQQPTAILRAMTVLDPQYLLGGMVKGNTGGSGWEKAVRYAPIAARKAQGGFDVKSQSTMSEILFDDKSVLSRSSDLLSSGAEKADEITWGRIWNACERQVKAQDRSIDMRTDAFNRKVAELFTEVIDQTQVVDGVLQRSQAMRSSNQIVQQATSFMGEPTQSLNIFLRAWDGVRRESDPKKAAKAVGVAGRAAFALICTDVVNALAQSLVDALRDDDEDKKYLDRVWSSFTGITGDEEEWTEYATNILFGNLGSNMNPAERIPVVKDAISIIQGYTVERMDTSGLADFIAAAMDTASLTGNGKKTQRYAVKQLITTGSKLFGISAANLLRDVWAIARSVVIERDDNQSLYEMQKQVYRIGDADNKKLYLDLAFKAQQDGDDDVVDEIAEELISLGMIEDREKFDDALYDRLEKKYMDTDEYEQKYSETLNAIGNALDQTGDYMDRGGKFQSKAMTRAEDYAKWSALREVDPNGELYESYDDLEKYDEALKYGLTPEEMILFDVAYEALRDDREAWAKAHKNEKPETTRKEDVIDMLEEMAWLTNRERSYLYLSKGYSEKNNPF